METTYFTILVLTKHARIHAFFVDRVDKSHLPGLFEACATVLHLYLLITVQCQRDRFQRHGSNKAYIHRVPVPLAMRPTMLQVIPVPHLFKVFLKKFVGKLQ